MEKRPCSTYCPIHARQGSRVSIQGMSRQTVSFPTLCLLGQPDKAIGLESQIEPWLAQCHPMQLAARRNRTERTEEPYEPAISSEGRSNYLASA